jgi:type IV secretory pathway VirB10-like protein
MSLANRTPARQVCRRAEDRLVITQPPTPSPTRPPKPASRTPLAFLALAVACVAAAGIGGYFAQSHQTPLPLPAVEASPAHATGNPAVPDTTAPPASAAASATADPSRPVAEPADAKPEARISARPEAVQPVEAKSPPADAPVEATRSRPAAGATMATRSTPAAAPASVPPSAPARTPEPAPAQPMPSPEPAAAVAVADPQRTPIPAEPAPAKAPALPDVQTFIIPADAVMGLEIEHSISSESARLEDRVEARVTRDVRGDGTIVLIPAGSRVRGEVTLVESGGKFKDRARLAIRFHTLLLADGQSVPIATDPLVREGDGVGRRTGTRIGASAAGGAIIGAIFGGEKGAALGAAAGAGAGTAATAASRPSEARFRAGSVVTVRLTAPVSITIEQ